MTARTPDPRYAELPAAVRVIYSYDEWVWLSDEQKGNLEQAETEPEWDE